MSWKGIEREYGKDNNKEKIQWRKRHVENNGVSKDRGRSDPVKTESDMVSLGPNINVVVSGSGVQ